MFAWLNKGNPRKSFTVPLRLNLESRGSGRVRPRNSALDESIRVRLRRINLRVLPRILQPFMPLKIYTAVLCQLCTCLLRDPPGLTNFEIMLVRQRVINMIHLGNPCQNLVRHLVHGRLYTRAVVFSERLQRNLPRRLPRSVEIRK